ncbi:MAG: hypothetical protein K2X03_03400 [Bryobacteraceae bacterium]|nr:hypothetical protein [Bryobacteraceae bacterium]
MRFRFLLLLGLLSLWGQTPPRLDSPRFDDLVRNDIFTGFGGDAAALERGMRKCEEILRANPSHAEALVWHGSSLNYLAGKAFEAGKVKEGTELAERGRAEMDRAVALEPKSIGVRIPRGATLLTSARYQPLDERVRADLEVGLEDYLVVYEMQKSYLAKKTAHSRGELLIGIAATYSQLGKNTEAKEWFERVAAQMEGTIYAKKAAKWLSGQKLAPAETGCIGCHNNVVKPPPFAR